MGKRVLAAFGVAAAMDGVLAAGLSAASNSADAATSPPPSGPAQARRPTCGRCTGRPWSKAAGSSSLPVVTGLGRTTTSRTRSRRNRPSTTSRAGRTKGHWRTASPHLAAIKLYLSRLLSDRAALDRYKARLSLYIGDVHGANSSDPMSSASTRSTGRAPRADSLLDTGCPPRPGSRRTPRREAISPTITLHPRKHA